MHPRRQDKRKATRLSPHRAAEVLFDANEPPVRCVVWDISDGGARLAVAHPIMSLPDIFTLLLGRDAGEPRKCKVVWTDTRFVGVKFV